MRIHLDSPEGANLLNIQYSVCFGTVFGQLFRSGSAVDDIAIAVSFNNSIMFIVLTLYFFLDWTFANFLRERTPFSLFRVLLFSVSIWFLGATVVLSNTSNPNKYYFIAAYALVVAVYHICTYFLTYSDHGIYNMGKGPAFVGFIMAIMTFLLGLVMLWNALLINLNITSANVQNFSEFMVAGFVFLKIFHMIIVGTNLE